jgi:hypothetical protein
MEVDRIRICLTDPECLRSEVRIGARETFRGYDLQAFFLCDFIEREPAAFAV